MATKSTIRQQRYDSDHTVRYALKLNKTTDKVLIEVIEITAKILGLSKQGAIKYLIQNSWYYATTPVTTQKEKRG